MGRPIWSTLANVPPIHAALGVDLDERLLYAVDNQGQLAAVDLESRGVRAQVAPAEQAVMVPDGSVYTTASRKVTHLVRRTPTTFRPVLPGRLHFLAGGPSDHLVAVTESEPPKLVIVAPDRQAFSTTPPRGEITTTYWGDLLAVAADTAVVLYETADPYGSQAVRVERHARHVAFSPSGHRLYVGQDDPAVLAFDRFTMEPLPSITLPRAPAAIRTDASGRWLLARVDAGDSVWVVDLTTARLAATVATQWAPDLPLVAGSSTLFVRENDDAVARDLAKPGLPERGRVRGGAHDVWLVTTWIPRERLPTATAAAESASVAQDSLLARDTTALEPPRLYLQVSSSQNPDWSKELAKQLTDAGYPAQVLDPTTVDEGYRVVVGPYGTREDAEETGRKLGRPYFILTDPPVRR